jgi:3-deoxy-D-manno-octulosonic acid kinase
MLSEERVERLGESAILYDGFLLNHMREAWFEPASWPRATVAPGRSGGRGATLFIERDGEAWVLRHYYRGGHIARFVSDRFLWLGEARNRAFREWRLLAHLRRAGLPVPRPVAARYLRSGLLYRADLITVRIPGVVPLSTRLATGSLDARLWRAIGACVGRFHAACVCHADLNAYNLQIDGQDRIFLLDFDRGRIMPGPGAWQRRNLARLQRSLRKISGADVAPANWAALLEGYHAARAAG